MDYNSDNLANLTKYAVVVMINVIIVSLILTPFINSTTTTTIDVDEVNTGDSGIDLAYYDSFESRNVKMDFDGDNVVFIGDYVNTVPKSDMIVMISDTSSLFIKNGSFVYYDGEVTVTTDSFTLVMSADGINGKSAEWVYFPTTDGKYSSYNAGYEHRLSDAVAVGNFMGITVASVNNDVLYSSMDGLYAHVNETETGVSNVTYDVHPNLMESEEE